MNSGNEPLVSIVTPFFNTDKYLSECIESVLRQSYGNWEYILVDNLSTDASLEIARKYEKEDRRIKVFRNSGFLSQVQNYNRALGHISPESKYCKIVQADDWIFPDCVSEMTRVAEGHANVGIVGAYRLDDVRVNCDGLPYPSTVVSGRDVCRLSLLRGLSVFGSATSILIRSDLVRNRKPFYNEQSRHEDTESCYEILEHVDFGFVHQVLTYTRRENESLTTRVRQFDPFYLLDRYIILLKYGALYLSPEEYAECRQAAEARYYRFIGERCWSGQRKELLKYHREGLHNIGRDLSRAGILRGELLALARFVMDGNRVIDYLVCKVRGGRLHGHFGHPGDIQTE